ncbi:MAG TPA: multidrug efflux SMR transporter [Candidatus Competibacteraceae bacterium]|nr:multidrug efflux SMR transporter [Candidatus Competibacteraceae bacterium]
MNAWPLLALAILAEVIATSALKLSDGFTRLWPSLIVCAGYLSAFYLLSVVVRRLDISVVYAIWSGAGVALIAVIGYLVFEESMSPLRIAGLLLTICGVVMLNLSSASH